VLREFKAFILRGNVVDLAVGIVIGIAFGAVVSALVRDLLTPLIGVIFGSHDFSGLTFAVRGSRFLYGDFLNALISFLTIAAAVFFFVVKPLNALAARRRGAEAPATKECRECLSNIPAAASRCAFCTSPQ
jgi:large conductance mechanosensitive channel